MLKDITIGQFFPGESPVHKMDPRAKILAVILYIVALFTCGSFYGYALLVVYLAVAVKISTISPKSLLRGLKPLILILVFTAILNLCYTMDGTVLVRIWRITITDTGILRAIFMVVRVMMLVVGTFLLTYTTSPITLTDGIESLLGPLKKLHAPVHELAMMMSIALRFIPTLIEETDKIMCAQKARGADFETGNVFHRAKALVPILVPLFVSAFRRADELATAMECRCYTGGVGRTKLSPLKWAGRDTIGMAVTLLVLVAVIILKVFGF